MSAFANQYLIDQCQPQSHRNATIIHCPHFTPNNAKVLRKIEEMKTRNLPPDQFRTQVDASIKSNLSVNAGIETRKIDHAATSRLDVASHFILRAAYCRTEDLRRWFLTQECRLFRHRLEAVASRGAARADGSGNDALRSFLARNDFDLERVSRSEKDELRDALMSVPGGTANPVDFHSAEYYRVPFVQALELVGRRECYVRRGRAYVPLTRIVSIVAAKFRVALSKSLAVASGVFGQVAHDEAARIGPLLKSMNEQYTGPGAPSAVTGADGEEVLTAATVDGLLARSMPLCMSQLHAGLKRDHKLKHQGRLQYGLFLKGAGMTLEEHTLFFQREFTRITTSKCAYHSLTVCSLARSSVLLHERKNSQAKLNHYCSLISLLLLQNEIYHHCHISNK